MPAAKEKVGNYAALLDMKRRLEGLMNEGGRKNGLSWLMASSHSVASFMSTRPARKLAPVSA